jgi:hypothetical protein
MIPDTHWKRHVREGLFLSVARLNLAKPSGLIMDLDSQQTRRFFLAGTVAFPTPSMTTGIISFHACNWTVAQGADKLSDDVVAVQEPHEGNLNCIRIMRRSDVAAIFIPGKRNDGGAFRNAAEPYLKDMDEGEWFIASHADPSVITERLRLAGDDISRRDSGLRGIVYLPATAPVLNIFEMAATAAESCGNIWPEPQYTRGTCLGGH